MSHDAEDPRPQELAEIYTKRRNLFGAEADRLGRRSRLISNARLLAFAGAATGLIWGLWDLDFPRLTQVLAGVVCLGGYIILVLIHDRVLRRLKQQTILRQINEEALGRLQRRWSDFPLPDVAPESPPPMVKDLDLFGRASLFHLLGTVNTPPGKAALMSWLLTTTTPEELRRRQAAASELAALLDWRQQLNLRGREISHLPLDMEPFFQWAEGETWLLARPWRGWIPALMGLTTVTLLTLSTTGLMSRPYWIFMVLINIVFSAVMCRVPQEIFTRVSSREKAFRHFAALFEHFAAASFSGELLCDLQRDFTSDKHSATSEMKRLDRIFSFADVRHSGMIHFALQALTLWDFHVLFFLERWQRRVGTSLRGWMSRLGDSEALCALAGLKHDNPSWSFPEILEDDSENAPTHIEARNMGHPLLAPSSCVANDVSLGPQGTFLLVTGSNMSGKSTLLRAIGVNVVLAQAGGPVAATSMKLPLVALGTSFRVQDSLEEGVSFFMSELRRLKEIVDLSDQCQADQCQAAGGRKMLYLLDEILQGTNVVERQIAVQRVLKHLLERGAIGAISTHDLTLAEAEGLAEAASPVHFMESFHEDEEGPRMTFDYKLRQGVAPTVNALKLLRIVGLG